MKNKEPRSIRQKILSYVKILSITIIILGLCLGCVALALNEITMGLCGNTITKIVPSPDKKYDAVAFLRDCGATTAWTPNVSVIKHGYHLGNTDGNIFRGSYGETFIDFNWKDNSTLIIQYSISSGHPVSLQETQKNGLQILYLQVQP